MYMITEFSIPLCLPEVFAYILATASDGNGGAPFVLGGADLFIPQITHTLLCHYNMILQIDIELFSLLHLFLA